MSVAALLFFGGCCPPPLPPAAPRCGDRESSSSSDSKPSFAPGACGDADADGDAGEPGDPLFMDATAIRPATLGSGVGVPAVRTGLAPGVAGNRSGPWKAADGLGGAAGAAGLLGSAPLPAEAVEPWLVRGGLLAGANDLRVAGAPMSGMDATDP